jgi:hypothetical protein
VHIELFNHARDAEAHMHRRIGIAALALGIAFGGACSRAAQVEGSGEREVIYQAAAVLTVRVVNHSQLDATIYLLHDGARDRLGTVTAATSVNFAVRARSLASGEFALLADPLGSMQTTTSERLHVNQGSEFTWTLETDFSRGSVLVRD